MCDIEGKVLATSQYELVQSSPLFRTLHRKMCCCNIAISFSIIEKSRPRPLGEASSVISLICNKSQHCASQVFWTNSNTILAAGSRCLRMLVKRCNNALCMAACLGRIRCGNLWFWECFKRLGQHMVNNHTSL